MPLQRSFRTDGGLMDQKRLFLAIAISLGILLGFQGLYRHFVPEPPAAARTATNAGQGKPNNTLGAVPTDATASQSPPPKEGARLAVDAPRVKGSISLVGARFDDLVLRDYHETVDKNSPLVRLLAPLSGDEPYYVEYGWVPEESGIATPGRDTEWKADAATLTPNKPVTLSWDNGAGLTFMLKVAVDADYMFSVTQSVRNTTGKPVVLHPYARVRRDYRPEVEGYTVLHEGLIGVVDGILHEITYKSADSDGAKNNGLAFEHASTGGWAGITDKYWLTALIPDQITSVDFSFRDTKPNGRDGYQVGIISHNPDQVAAGAESASTTHLFAGAKVVSLLDHYQAEYHIPSFWEAVDFGWFWFITRPFFYALDWLYHLVGNFGVAILIFTVLVKAAFYPLASKSYRSMSKMRLLAPKIQSLRERYKDDPTRMQQEVMQLYKAEGANPASGCLPMLLQFPIFFSLYKVIFVTIEMRHAPFFGWIHDLSAVDPTNLFNLFGLLPFDPTHISPFLHLGIWPLIMGGTMYLQQKMNPPMPDPVQARMFQFMPIIFTFMLARFPVGLVIYWSWNNLLSIGQQWLIQRRTKLPRPELAKV
ncbi:60 kDa inner membrane protein YIDC [Granulibacter bethesdensis]|nr:60 kDa inner membrane protein YIDC [Granulibacter bethesdensis CGDNIH1]AHJ67770.1 60 kDa inner membrane protein YIDC [Granulibacter bethesdensis]APH51429.1 60 kDa inner membrane protein YIDC [Granulibacter bethesdensis]APH64122.1 60 kDa inner membrane protein YIDC [Granulibacter bethesdensis]